MLIRCCRLDAAILNTYLCEFYLPILTLANDSSSLEHVYNNETDTIPSQLSHPWLTVAIDNITNTQAVIALERSEVYDRITVSNYLFDALGATESIGYIVMDRSVRGNFRPSSSLLVNFESIYS